MAEGAGALVLESLEHAKARGAKILGVIEGCGEMADSFHRTRSSPDGKPIIGCIRNAIADAGLTPDDIDYINPHGTGTPENDKMEYMGVMAVFGERAKSIPISSNKSMIGHTLSAAGAVEAVFTLMTLEHQRVPPTINYAVPDPAIPLDVVPNVARDAKVRHALSNSFGFGGQNVSLVMGREPDVTGRMRALTLVADRKLELPSCRRRPRPAPAKCRCASRRSALNHLDVWGWRGMAFAKRKLPLVVGVEAAGEIAAVGAGVTGFKPGDPVVMYGGLTCGTCKACREGRDNLCENVAGVMGFHVDGFARDLLNMPARLVIPVPAGVALPRRRLRADRVRHRAAHAVRQRQAGAGETMLVQAGGSGIGTTAIKMAKAIGATVITTVGDDEKAEKAKALGADHVINYRTDRFEASCASSPPRKASTSCSSMSAPTPSTARCSASSAAAGW